MIDSDEEHRNRDTRPEDEPSGDVSVVEPGHPAAPPLRSLDPRVIALWRVEGTIRTLFLTGGAFVAGGFMFGGLVSTLVLAGAIALLSVFHAVAWPPLRYRKWGFAIRDDDVFLRYGVLWKVTSVIPHRRLQHVDTERGPVERWLGLSRVIIFTAGSRGAQTTIPGLSHEDAVLLRDQLGRLGQGDDAV